MGILKHLFESLARQLIMLTVIIVFAERTDSKLVYLFIFILMVWAYLFPIAEGYKEYKQSSQDTKAKIT